MSEIASAVEQARKASASIWRLEQAIARDPSDRALHLNLAAANKLAAQARQQLQRSAEMQQVDLCDYRLLPSAALSYALAHVSKSFLQYQNLFSQVHDALTNGLKVNAAFGDQAAQESGLEFGYSYSGSLGVVLLAQSERDFFSGRLDKSIDALFDAVKVSSLDQVREVADKYGKAVVKRLREWSKANVDGGFATDVRWNRSDGRQLGQVVERESMANMLSIMDQASDEKRETIQASGILVGGDVMSGSFHFVVPDGESYRGAYEKDGSLGQMVLDKRYDVVIEQTTIEMYATDKTIRRFVLKSLQPSG